MSISNFFRSRVTVPALVVGILGVLMVLYAWHLPPFNSSIESTNNAYVRGQVTLLSPQISGLIAEVPVQDYAQVKKERCWYASTTASIASSLRRPRLRLLPRRPHSPILS